MKHPNDLFRLIKSMTKAEKRYFKLNASKHLHHGQHNSIRLFDAIDAQGVYDQEAIRKRFSGERFARQLAVQKNYLYALILKTLRAYHTGTSVSVRVAELLHAVEVLSDRGLYEQCPDLLDRALRLARDHEEFALELRVLELARHIAYELDDAPRRDAAILQQRGTLERVSNLLDHEDIALELAQLRGLGMGNAVDVERALLEREDIRDETRASSLRALVRMYNTRMNCSMKLGDTATCLASARRSLEILARFAEVPTNLEHHLLLCHYVPMVAALSVRNAAVIRSQLSLVADVHVRSQYARAHKRFLLVHFGLLAEMLDADLTAVRAAAPRVEAFLRERPTGVRANLILGMHRELAHAYLALDDAPRSLAHANRMLEYPMPAGIPESAIQPRVHAAMLHLELGNLENVEYVAQAARRCIARLKADGPAIRRFLTYLRRLASIASPEEGARETSRFLALLERDQVAVAQLARYTMVNPEAWIASRLNNVSYGEAYRQRRRAAAGGG